MKCQNILNLPKHIYFKQWRLQVSTSTLPSSPCPNLNLENNLKSLTKPCLFSNTFPQIHDWKKGIGVTVTKQSHLQATKITIMPMTDAPPNSLRPSHAFFSSHYHPKNIFLKVPPTHLTLQHSTASKKMCSSTNPYQMHNRRITCEKKKNLVLYSEKQSLTLDAIRVFEFHEEMQKRNSCEQNLTQKREFFIGVERERENYEMLIFIAQIIIHSDFCGFECFVFSFGTKCISQFCPHKRCATNNVCPTREVYIL